MGMVIDFLAVIGLLWEKMVEQMRYSVSLPTSGWETFFVEATCEAEAVDLVLEGYCEPDTMFVDVETNFDSNLAKVKEAPEEN